MAPETGFLRESVDKGEVFSSKNPVYEVGCVSHVKLKYLPLRSTNTSIKKSAKSDTFLKFNQIQLTINN